MANKLSETLVKELILGFGFVEGFWIAVGTNPLSEIAKAFEKLVPEEFTFSNPLISIMILISIIQIMAIYYWGGVIGLLALILAFLGGVLIVKSTIFAILLIFVGIALGSWAFSMENKITIQDIIEGFRKK